MVSAEHPAPGTAVRGSAEQGKPVFIAADTLDAARDAAEALEIEWDALPHVVGAEAALEKDAPQIWPDRPGNLSFEVTFGDQAKTQTAFAKAARVVSLKVVNQRVVTGL